MTTTVDTGTIRHDSPASTEHALVPGRVYWIGYGENNPHRANPTGTGDRTWFYLVSVLGDVLFGVAFSNSNPDGAAPVAGTVASSLVFDGSRGGYSHHPVTVVAWWPNMLAEFFRTLTPGTTSGTTSGDQTTDQAYRRGVADGRAEASREFDAWKARAEEIAHEYADSNELCSEFDRCMQDVGLSPRRRTYDVTYRVTLPRGIDVDDLDAEDLYNHAEDGAGSPWYVTSV